MGIGEFAVVAASLLTALGVMNDIPESERTVSGFDAIRFVPTRNAVLMDEWPVSSGEVRMPHLKEAILIQNAVAGSPAASTVPLHVCLTSTGPLDVDAVESWYNQFQSTTLMHVHIFTASDQRHAREKQLIIRRLVSLFRKELSRYAEVHIPASALTGLLPAAEEALLVQRSMCAAAIWATEGAATAAVLAVDVSCPIALPMSLTRDDSTMSWRLVSPQRPFSSLRNYLAAQATHFALRNDVQVGGDKTGAVVVVDAEGTWELEKLRVGYRAFFGPLSGPAGRLLSLWTHSHIELFRMSGSIPKAYSLLLRAMQTAQKWTLDLSTLVRSFDFGFSHTNRSFHVRPLSDIECAAYQLHVLEPNVISTVMVDSQQQKKKGVIGRIQLTVQSGMDTCDTLLSSGTPLQLCQHQVDRFVAMRSSRGEEPKPCRYCSIIPLLQKKGYCAMGGSVSLRFRRSYGSYSDYGVFPRGFDDYDIFSLMEGSITGDSQAQHHAEVSVYNPKETTDEDRPRVLPTLVPVRLKKAK